MSKIINMIIQRFALIGQVPLCNGIASRAPHLFGFCFPLCYRCTFIILFFLFTFYYCYKMNKKGNLSIMILCMIPMMIDGCIQTFLGIESTNIRRVITGTLFGYGLGYFIYQGCQWFEWKYWGKKL